MRISLSALDATVFNAKVDVTGEILCQCGIRVGHVYHAVERIREAHRHCPYAHVDKHDFTGEGLSEITFAAALMLSNKLDPDFTQNEVNEVCRQFMEVASNNHGGTSAS